MPMVSSKGIDGNKLSISKLNILKCPPNLISLTMAYGIGQNIALERNKADFL